MAQPVIRKQGQDFSRSQQAAMYYARKRRRQRAIDSEPHDVFRRERAHLGFSMRVELQAV